MPQVPKDPPPHVSAHTIGSNDRSFAVSRLVSVVPAAMKDRMQHYITNLNWMCSTVCLKHYWLSMMAASSTASCHWIPQSRCIESMLNYKF